jgi:nucleoside phosphorylase
MVMAVGICFGMLDDKHSLTDVLVSESIADYEMVRQGSLETRERGVRQPAGSRLLAASRIARRMHDSGEFAVHHGLILSGQKLVDSSEFRNELKKRFPDAIGGEMEGAGIVAAATRGKAEWLVVKAVCDWGTGKDDKAQVKAAANAAEFAMKVIEFVLDAEANKAT